MNPAQQRYFFNRARCECDGDVANYSGYVKIVIQPSATTPQTIQALLAANLVGGTGVGRLYASRDGVDCLIPDAYAGSISAYCTNLLDPSNYLASFPMTAFETQRFYESPPIPVAWLYGSANSCGATGTCDATSVCATATTSRQSIFFWAQTSSGTLPDVLNLTFELSLSAKVPYVPTNVTVVAATESLVVNWGWLNGLDPSADADFRGVQLFCQRETDAQVFKTGNFSQSYMTSASLCPSIALAASPTGAFGNLDPRYLCSGLVPATNTGYRITGLQGGIPYGVGVAAVDKYGNISAISDVVYATPNEWGGSTAQGGFTAHGCSCALAGWQRRPGTMVSLVFLGIGLLVAIRKRRRRVQPGGSR